MFKRALIAIVAVLVVASIYLSNLVSDPEPPRHQVFLNGEVLTMDPTNSILRPSAYAVAVSSQWAPVKRSVRE